MGKESKMSIPDLETYLPKVISWRRDLHMHPELDSKKSVPLT